ncbi:MAG: hypothetical protein IJ635_03785 [Bacteroidaceae bacterium]|nr:hypothetical protein [Bacteroidaceae bacterium]
MKKFLLLLVLVCTTNMVFAQSEPTRTILHPTSNGNLGDKDGNQRAPLAPVYVYQDDHTLTFGANMVGCTVMLADNNGCIVFTDVVNESGTVEIPEEYTGAFELQLIRGDITFIGEIEL